MSNPMRIRSQLKGDVAKIVIGIAHDMETGLMTDPKTKQPIPAHFIQQVSVEVGGKMVMQAQTGTAVSKNPSITLSVKGVKAGDNVVVKWADNKGGKGDKTEAIK